MVKKENYFEKFKLQAAVDLENYFTNLKLNHYHSLLENLLKKLLQLNTIKSAQEDIQQGNEIDER